MRTARLRKNARMTIKFSKYLYLLLIIASGLFLQCKKNPLDKRSKYIGNWTFTLTVTYTNNYQEFFVSHNTISVDPNSDPFHNDQIIVDVMGGGKKCRISSKPFHDNATISGDCTGKFIDRKHVIIDFPKESSTYSGMNVELTFTGTKE